jgi:hypothetical protein
LLIAAALGLVLAIVGALSIEQPPSAAIVRGDFPAFYTLAALASKGEGARLYDLELQRQVQNTIWPSLQGAVLPVAYPAFLAFCIEPLASLSPFVARIVWTIGMMVCVVAAAALVARTAPALRGLTWQILVISLLFSPFFVGVLGGQIVALSVFLYAASICLGRKGGGWWDVALGMVCGLWMYKPHFACGAVLVLLLQRRWVSVVAWLGTSVLLWALGASVAGVAWPVAWYSFVREFAYIDLLTNAHQMTGIVPFLYLVCRWSGSDWGAHPWIWELATFVSSLVVPIALWQACGSAHARKQGDLFLLVGPLLVLCAPAVNFYDLVLCALPLLFLFDPRRRSDLAFAGGVVVFSQLVVGVKGSVVGGACFLFALFLTYLVVRAVNRDRAEALEGRDLIV